MDNYRNLLLMVSPDMQHTHAWIRAVELARKTGASLHLCLVDYKPAIANLRHIDSSVMRMAADNYMGIRLRWLENEAAMLARQGIKAECSVIWGKAADESIIAAILDRRPDLVIKDVGETLPILHTVFTPLDWQLLRMSPAPLMLVNSRANSCPNRIIATVDPMEDGEDPNGLNDQILRTALDLAAQFDAQMHVVYAYPHLDTPAAPVEGAQQTYHQKIHHEAHAAHKKAFGRLMDRYSVPHERRHFLERKDIEVAISEFADRIDSDLIVMGTTYRSKIEQFMLGSTAERLLYRINCDVLALKPEGFEKHLPQLIRGGASDSITYLPGKQ